MGEISRAKDGDRCASGISDCAEDAALGAGKSALGVRVASVTRGLTPLGLIVSFPRIADIHRA